MSSTAESALPKVGNVAFDPIVHGQSVGVADDVHLGVAYRRQAVRHHREAGDAERHRAEDVAVVQRHLEPLVEILVVHVVDAVHRMHVGAREPLHGRVELRHHLVVFEHVRAYGQRRRGDLRRR